MGLTDAFLAYELHLNLLTWAHLCDEDVIEQGLWRWDALTLKSLFLLTEWHPLEIARVHICVFVVFVLVACVFQN